MTTIAMVESQFTHIIPIKQAAGKYKPERKDKSSLTHEISVLTHKSYKIYSDMEIDLSSKHVIFR